MILRTPRFDSLKMEVAKGLGVKVLYAGEVRNIVENLGREYRPETIRSQLSDIAINPADFGIESVKYGIDKQVKLYPQDEVWNYLTSLEAKKVINLNGRSNMEEILQEGLNKRPIK